MSEVASRDKPSWDLPINLKEIPAEIWLYIFRLASAEPPEIFNTSPVVPGGSREGAWTVIWFDAEIANQMKHGWRMQIRLALVLVSKFFRSLATEVLYEHIALRQYISIPRFVRTLEEDEKRDTSNSEVRHLGTYVKFLQLKLNHIKLAQWTPAQIESLKTAFRLLPNLKLYDVGVQFDFYHLPIAQAILTTVINMRAGTDRYLQPLLTQPQTPTTPLSTLEVLSLSLADPSLFDLNWSELEPKTFAKLHTLQILSNVQKATVFKWLARCTFLCPSLYILLQIQNDELDGDDLELFFKAHGTKVTALEIEFFTTPKVIERILTHCPIIEDIYISVNVLDHVPFATLLSDHLVSIGISTYLHIEKVDPPVVRAIMREFNRALNSLLLYRSKSLKSIRLIELEKAEFTKGITWTPNQGKLWKEWSRMCVEKGVTLMLHGGEIVNDELGNMQVAVGDDDEDSEEEGDEEEEENGEQPGDDTDEDDDQEEGRRNEF